MPGKCVLSLDCRGGGYLSDNHSARPRARRPADRMRPPGRTLRRAVQFDRVVQKDKIFAAALDLMVRNDVEEVIHLNSSEQYHVHA
jgi:hypothetical protein